MKENSPLLSRQPYHHKGIKPPHPHEIKHTLTFQRKKIDLSIACKKAFCIFAPSNEISPLKREDNRKHTNPLLYRVTPFNTCFSKEQSNFALAD